MKVGLKNISGLLYELFNKHRWHSLLVNTDNKLQKFVEQWTDCSKKQIIICGLSLLSVNCRFQWKGNQQKWCSDVYWKQCHKGQLCHFNSAVWFQSWVCFPFSCSISWHLSFRNVFKWLCSDDEHWGNSDLICEGTSYV